ncbi:MAG: hypothetical protein ACRD43_12490 [Pyrinomonadaceae bacterium]
MIVGIYIGFYKSTFTVFQTLVLSALSGLIKSLVAAVMLYNRATDGHRDISVLPGWWYADQLKLLVLEFFVGFLIALIPLLAVKYILAPADSQIIGNDSDQ